jgi:t-SNARE complex subunit (syntaxin)
MQQEPVPEQRIDSMKNIEKMIGEIGSIFQRLGNIVQMHEVMIDRIDKNTDSSLQSIEKGKKNINEVY